MNILFISQRVPFPANKGEKIRTYNQIKFLASFGHHITIATPVESQQDINYCRALSEPSNISCLYQTMPSKILRLFSGILQNTPLSVANFYNSKLQKEIDRQLSTKTFDAIVCTSSAVAKYIFYSQALPRLNSKPKLLMDFMDLDSDKWQQYADNSPFPMSLIYQREAKLLAQYEVQIQSCFDACFFIADAEVNLFKQTVDNANNVHTLGNGLNTDEFYPPAQAPQNVQPKFIFTGVMDYKPNVDAVVWFVEQCWQKILTKYPNAEFIIAGMNPNTAVQNLTKFPGITITGFVDEILPYYHKADYFVAPFRLARGVQNKVLQAFACGLPVISTPMGAEGIDCIPDENILLAETPDDFLSAIQLLEEDSTLKDTIKTSALKLIKEQYSWQGKLQLLKDLLNNKQSNI